MPQGFRKGKAKVLAPGNQKKIDKNKGPNPKTQSRKNRPIEPKKARHEEVQKLKKIITKNVNKAIEEQVRGIATDSQKVHLSKKKDKNININAEMNKMPPKQS
nr:uncharacterized protein LOC106692800 [Halyomorpha halys]XP_014294464.1 uncharacterized protein LOC106692800 [Halyomorpha halys]